MSSNNRSLVTFHYLAAFCVLTQVLNPILMNYESRTIWYPGIPWYKQEQNFCYYLRNGLSTVANLILQGYCLVYILRLWKRLGKLDQVAFRNIKLRVAVLCIIIEVYLLTFLGLIWLQNLWWYATGPGMWIAFQSTNIVCTVCIPTLCFSLLVIE